MDLDYRTFSRRIVADSKALLRQECISRRAGFVVAHPGVEHHAMQHLFKSELAHRRYCKSPCHQAPATKFQDTHTQKPASCGFFALPKVGRGRHPGYSNPDPSVQFTPGQEFCCLYCIQGTRCLLEVRQGFPEAAIADDIEWREVQSKKPASSSLRYLLAASASISRPSPGASNRSTMLSFTICGGKPITKSSHQGSEAVGYSKAM